MNAHRATEGVAFDTTLITFAEISFRFNMVQLGDGDVVPPKEAARKNVVTDADYCSLFRC